MLPLVFGQIATFHSLHQRLGLTERQTKAFSRNGVNRPRGIADQGNPATKNPFQPSR
jgi:hypothetical protein